MLRITILDEPGTVTFRLEGRLAGSWVQEMRDCLQNAKADRPTAAVRIDLTQVTFIDAAGKELLAASDAQGAVLVACGCLMKAIVAEITGRASSACSK